MLLYITVACSNATDAIANQKLCYLFKIKDVKPKFKFFKNILKLSKVVRYVVFKIAALEILCLILLEQKLQRFESLFWSLV